MLLEHPPGDQVEVALQKIGRSVLRVRGWIWRAWA